MGEYVGKKFIER